MPGESIDALSRIYGERLENIETRDALIDWSDPEHAGGRLAPRLCEWVNGLEVTGIWPIQMITRVNSAA